MDPCMFIAARKANRGLFRHYQDALSETGISIVQLSILRFLERHGPQALSRLADDHAMERTSWYRTIEPLIESGAVQAENASKGKSKSAKLASEGQSTIARALPFRAIAQ